MYKEERILELIDKKENYLHFLRLRKAQEGISTPASVLMDIEDTERELERLNGQLEWIQAERANIISNLELPYGTMSPDSKFYVEREADSRCQQYLENSKGVTLFVRAPRQMGKSSLVHRLLVNHKSAFVDLQKISRDYLKDEEAFLKEFCFIISKKLEIEPRIEDYWDSRRTNVANCEQYLADYVIPTVEASFVLAIDELGGMTTCPFRNNFFGMLRTWHNNRAEKDSNFRRMSLLLSSAMNPNSLISTSNQSPFNVAHPIPLKDFTPNQVKSLNKLYAFPLNDHEVNQLMDLVGGHPFLTRLAMHYLTINYVDLQTLRKSATQDESIFSNHLEYLSDILEKLRLRELLARVCCKDHTKISKLDYFSLRNLGLVKQVDGKIVPRNGLYKRFFRDHLGIPMNGCPDELPSM